MGVVDILVAAGKIDPATADPIRESFRTLLEVGVVHKAVKAFPQAK